MKLNRASKPNLLALIATACLAWFALSCAGTSREANDAESKQYQVAAQVAKQDAEEGKRLFMEFLDQNPTSPLADDAAAQLADLSFQDADEQGAAGWLQLIVRDYPDEANADRARVLLAGMEARNGRVVEARRLLTKVRFERLNPAEARLAYRLFAGLSDDPVDRLNWQVRERFAVVEELKDADYESPVLGGGLEDLEREIITLVDSFSDEDLNRASRLLRRDLPAGRILLLLSRRALQRGDFEAANNYFERADGHDFMSSDKALFDEVVLALELRERIVEDGGTMPSFADVAAMPRPDYSNVGGVIGVVLPLSGRFAKYGEQSLNGIVAAARIFGIEAEVSSTIDIANEKKSEPRNEGNEGNKGRDENRLRLVVRDSEGLPETAALAVVSLAAEDDLIAIIGPLLGDTAEAAAPVADQLGIPLISLTSREEVPQNRSYVFRLRTSPRDEIRALVDYASSELGAKRYAILYPKDNYGRGMRDNFWEAVSAEGGMVVASSGYETDATDFARPIRDMVGYKLLTQKEKAALERRETVLRRSRRLDPEEQRLVRDVANALAGPEGDPLPPQVDFDVLFIPDSHDKVILISPQLTFHEIDDVNLMGPSGWNHPELVSIGRKHVRGAVISALFHEESRFEFVSDFVRHYTETFGETPDVFAAHGFDAARLVMAQLIAGADDREEVRNGILRTQGFPGASGVINMAPDGNARKRPFLLKVRGGKFVSLD